MRTRRKWEASFEGYKNEPSRGIRSSLLVLPYFLQCREAAPLSWCWRGTEVSFEGYKNEPSRGVLFSSYLCRDADAEPWLTDGFGIDEIPAVSNLGKSSKHGGGNGKGLASPAHTAEPFMCWGQGLSPRLRVSVSAVHSLRCLLPLRRRRLLTLPHHRLLPPAEVRRLFRRKT